MIDRIPDLIHTQTGEYNGTTFDIIPKETFAMVCRKVNEVIDFINHQNHEYESIYDVVNDRMIGCDTLDIPKSYKTRPENVQPDAESRPVNVQDHIANAGKMVDVGELAFLSKENSNLKDELERTRKALDVAIDWLGQVATPEKCDDDLCREFTKRKLAEIKTALEQKD